MTTAHASDILLDRLRAIVGAAHVLTAEPQTRRYRRGYRYGEGKVLAVVRPGSLVEQWRILNAVVAAGRIVVMQAANTGLTGGSAPFDDGYDRQIVIVNTMRIDRIDLIESGAQVVCLAGATLHNLERKLRPLGRQPHSIIGSTTIGASVVGGVCNNSGGALLRRGPAFTQLALFARVDADGSVTLVNHLGIELGGDAETILDRLDRGDYTEADIDRAPGKLASDPDYQTLIRDIEATTPARYNNDPRLLYEVAGSAGKLCVFAVRLDTFPAAGSSRVFYIGTNDHLELTGIRRNILAKFANLPVAGEYLHRDAFDLTEKYGKDLYLYLKYVGPERIALAFALKSRFDAITSRFGWGGYISDRILQGLVGLLPSHLPRRLRDWRDRYDHHLLLRMEGDGIEEARAYLSTIMPSATGDVFECDDEEAAAAFRHRYAIGGASIRYRALHTDTVEDIVAFDLALPRNTRDWRESSPVDIEQKIVGRIRCGHFFCQVFHYDYLIKKGEDWRAIKSAIADHLGSTATEFPSEHNVGHLYQAKPALLNFYRALDPTNTFNPGIGQTSRRRDWA